MVTRAPTVRRRSLFATFVSRVRDAVRGSQRVRSRQRFATLLLATGAVRGSRRDSRRPFGPLWLGGRAVGGRRAP